MTCEGNEKLNRARLSWLNVDEIFVGRGFNPAERLVFSPRATVPVWLREFVVRARLQPCRNFGKIAAASAAEVPLCRFFSDREMAKEKYLDAAICQHSTILLE
jgi:hypothetical protein